MENNQKIKLRTPFTVFSKEYETREKTVEKTTQKTTQKILELLKEYPFMSRKEIADNLENISEDGVKYNLAKLNKDGHIRRIGPDKGGHWEVVK